MKALVTAKIVHALNIDLTLFRHCISFLYKMQQKEKRQDNTASKVPVIHLFIGF